MTAWQAPVREQLDNPGSAGLAFEDRLALRVDREVAHRDNRRQARLLQQAKLRYGQATLEDLDASPGRGIERSTIMSLALGNWVETAQ